MAETNVILKYRRPQDSWLCPACDSENTLSYTSCSVCGSGMGAYPSIVRAWSEMDEKAPSIPMTGRTDVKPMFAKKESHCAKTVFWTVAAVVVVILMVYYFGEMY